MAEKTFVIYSSTTGTATARPVLEFYNEDETHTPDLPTLGYDVAEVSWVATDPFAITDTTDAATGRLFSVNPSTGAVAQTSAALTDLATAQLAKEVEANALIQEWNWTQELDAKITKATQQAFADWIAVLDAVDTDPLWATNPAGIVLPAPPAVSSSAPTVAQQMAETSWLDDASMPAQKLAIANWNTLQTVWGFDWADFGPFNTASFGNGSVGAGPTPALTWVAGRTGDRAIRMTGTGDRNSRCKLWTRSNYGFAASPGDAFLIETWVRASSYATTIFLELAGWPFRLAPPNVLDGGSAGDVWNNKPGPIWRKMTGLAIIPAGTGIKWAGGQVHMLKGENGTEWIEVDGLTITRLPTIPNAYAQNGATTGITSTVTGPGTAQTLLTIDLARGGSAANTMLSASARIITSNITSDVMRLQFWITMMTATEETILSTWQEYGQGQWQQRATAMQVADATDDVQSVKYHFKVTKLTSVGTLAIGHKFLSGTVLPKV